MDKTEIARRQLGKALALFLEDQDSVSVHCLACGGSEIAEHLTLKAGVEPFSAHILRQRPDLNEGKLRGIRNQHWNAFKHATTKGGLDRQDEELLARFSDAINDHVLYIGWLDYGRAVSALPLEAQAFQVWYYAMYPEKLNPDEEYEEIIQIFGTDLRAVPRAEAKRRLRVVIEHYRGRQELMQHPSTENRPLDLGPIS
jgi:hypothetical protein